LKTSSFSLLPFHQHRQGKGIKRHQNLCRIMEKNQTQHRVLGLILDVSALTSPGFPSPRCLSFSTDCKVTSSTTFVSPKHFSPRDCLQHCPGRVCLDAPTLLFSHVFAERYSPSTGRRTISHEIYCHEKNASEEYMKIISRKRKHNTLPVLFSGKPLTPQVISVKDQRFFLLAVKQPKFYSSYN